MRRFFLAALALLCLGVGASYATNFVANPYQTGNDLPQGLTRLCSWFGTACAVVNKDGTINVRVVGKSRSAAGGSYTLSGSSVVYIPANAARQFLAIDNPSASINIACAFGGTAVINTGGSYMVPAGATRTWPAVVNGPVPTDYIACIAASGSPTITITEAQ